MMMLPLQRLGVSGDKGYELELSHSRQEVYLRLGFARTLLGFQMALIAASVGGIGAAIEKNVGALLLEGLAAVLIWIVFAVATEIEVNQDTIKALVRFIDSVLLEKYFIQGKDGIQISASEWDRFHQGKHPKSDALANLKLSVSSASEVVNLTMLVRAFSLYISEAIPQATFAWRHLCALDCMWLVAFLLFVTVVQVLG